MGGSELNVRGLLGEYAAGNGPAAVTVLANRFVLEAYAGFERGPVRLHHVPSYRPGNRDATRLGAMVLARLAPRRAARALPGGLDAVHYPVTVPIPRVDVPRVVTLHDVQHHELPALFSAGERRFRAWAYDGATRSADRVVTSSEYSRGRLIELLGLDADKVATIPMGIDHERFTPAPAPDEERHLQPLDLPERFVIYPANLWPHKNHHRLVEALGRTEDPELHLVLTGQTYGRAGELMAKAAGAGVAERVRHLGFVDAEAVAPLMRRARAMAFPSLYEGFGAPPLEAMACGTPVASSLRASLREACAGAVAELDPEDPASIAAAIDRAAGHEEARAELRAAGLDRAAGFTWADAARAHTRLYETL